MLNIYYGRESINKEKFVYSRIAARGFSVRRPVLVIVPDQYTLEAERQAFRFLDTESLLGLDVYSMSRLGHAILKELGFSEGDGVWTLEETEYTLTVLQKEEETEAGILRTFTVSATGDGKDLFSLPSTRYLPKEVSP